jgi:hypothetical protein
MAPLLPDFYYSLKTRIFFGPTQGPKLFQNEHESSIPWSECGVVILHGAEHSQSTAVRETTEALIESTINRKVNRLMIGLETLEQEFPYVCNLVSSLPFKHLVFVSIGGNKVMQRSRHLLHKITREKNDIACYFVAVPVSLGMPCFMNSELFIPDHLQRLGQITNDDAGVAHAVWFNPTFTLKSQVEIDSVAMLGEVLSRFTTSLSALPRGFSPHHRMNYSIYWYYIPQILSCIDEAHETPEDYEIRAFLIWNSVIASLPVLYPQYGIPTGNSEGSSYMPGGAIKETALICSVLFPDISPIRIQAEVTYALFNHLLSSRGTEIFGSLQGDMSALLQEYRADPLQYWKSRISKIIGPLQLPDAISELTSDSESYSKEEPHSSVALWNLLNSVRITSDSGASLISPETYAQASVLLSSLAW